MSVEVDLQWTDAEHVGIVEITPAQDSVDASDNFVGVERLNHIIIRADPQCLQLVHLLIQRRQHYYRHAATRPQLCQDAPSVELGHLDVEKDEVGLQSKVKVQCAAPISRMDRAKPLPFEIGA